MITWHLLMRFFKMMQEQGLADASEDRAWSSCAPAANSRPPCAASSSLPKNSIGLRNLYRLISYGNLKYFKRVPIMPKSELLQWREGLIIGSACEGGRVVQDPEPQSGQNSSVSQASMTFWRFSPSASNRFMLDKGLAEDAEEELRGFNRTIVRLGEELGKPVVATGDVHFLDPGHEIFRHILLATKQMPDADRPLPLYRTTDEMMGDSPISAEKAHRGYIIENPNRIVDWCETLRPVPHNLFAPRSKPVEDQKPLSTESSTGSTAKIRRNLCRSALTRKCDIIFPATTT